MFSKKLFFLFYAGRAAIFCNFSWSFCDQSTFVWGLRTNIDHATVFTQPYFSQEFSHAWSLRSNIFALFCLFQNSWLLLKHLNSLSYFALHLLFFLLLLAIFFSHELFTSEVGEALFYDLLCSKTFICFSETLQIDIIFLPNFFLQLSTAFKCNVLTDLH